MPRVVFTAQLERHVAAPPADVEGVTVRDALEAALAQRPTLRGYVLDDQGHLRKHVVVFVDGVRVTDRVRLADPVGPTSRIDVLQALTGG